MIKIVQYKSIDLIISCVLLRSMVVVSKLAHICYSHDKVHNRLLLIVNKFKDLDDMGVIYFLPNIDLMVDLIKAANRL